MPITALMQFLPKNNYDWDSNDNQLVPQELSLILV
jgi:hypothetical protein